MMQLSAPVAHTSISNSFQPISDSSISSSRVGERVQAAAADGSNSPGCRRCRRGAARCERGADHHRETDPAHRFGDFLLHRPGFFHRMGDAGARPIPGRSWSIACLNFCRSSACRSPLRARRSVQRRKRQHARFSPDQRAVERRSAAHGGSNASAFPCDDGTRPSAR